MGRGRRQRGKQLSLVAKGSRGGFRAAAGRKSGTRRVPHRARAPISRHTPLHVTLRVVEGVPSLP